ncbi:MAG: hypothetical protein F4X14_20340 [Caldilineaceae bacterium SB0661_bin_32]|uniref:Conserved hypothetical protein CHP02391 domain-containing protein n=1 Tax=Caldilineaceae bacterium SB0661_bin_32 TaxID=2605255 RepID=A0A6B1DD40_9CHLR|nr:hypothetical protein [Caldilineaceae bacterium SB0661_bin_32]
MTNRSRRINRTTITYHSHIYNLAMSASGEAMALGLALSHYVASKRSSSAREDSGKELESLRNQTATLRQAVDKLLSALPSDAGIDSSRLSDHLGWIEHWLKRSSPISCAHDPIDIVRSDIPGVLKQFDKWYASQSVLDRALSDRIMPFIESGQLNAAIREAWPIFKTRMVERFGLSSEIDGSKLVVAIFGPDGATAGLLPGPKRDGYLNLFKGLYALSRNPLSHNDIRPNPAEVEAALLLISTTLTKVEQLPTEERPSKEGSGVTS